ncbi:hypothetical protein B0J11DRAFT_502064 [Dendryphion nanum]|uniref:Uncharacterized protein n=1 Tax=Dendryphion nanum TaxID=256645 RepID=A0A9P9ECQ6_9PLEO|nr:hypothetical protein B0J11DRAFT_502064 [Dendryphion nanum]
MLVVQYTTVSYMSYYQTVDSSGRVTVTSFGPLETLTLSWMGDATNEISWEPPCCGACTMRIKHLELFYWPDQATLPPSPGLLGSRSIGDTTTILPFTTSSYVDDEGFTFISPSVYMAITSLRAWDKCGSIGDTYLSTTIAFNAHEVSTFKFERLATEIICPGVYIPIYMTTITRQMTFADLHGDCSTAWNGYFYNPDFPLMWMMSQDPCHPIIQIPSRVRDIHPGWASCVPQYGAGFYDPPKTLRQAHSLIPTMTAHSEIPHTKTFATPESRPSDIPSQTSTRVSSPMMTVGLPIKAIQDSPIAIRLPPVPAQPNPTPASTIITIRPATGANEAPQIITFTPTHIPNPIQKSPPDPSFSISANNNRPNPSLIPAIIIDTHTLFPNQILNLTNTLKPLAPPSPQSPYPSTPIPSP